LRFPGQYFDRETNLAYNYFRDYDSGIGRYVQSDLIGLKGGVNTYSSAIENPMQHVDLLGLHVSFCYYPNLPTHIGFAVEGEVQTQGFYPAHPKWPFDKGKVKPDPMDEPRECKTVPTTPDQDRCMVNCRKRRIDNPGIYNGLHASAQTSSVIVPLNATYQ